MFTAYLVAFCRSAIGLVFAVSFIGKVRDRLAFEQAISRFGLLPERLNKYAASLFLIGEFGVVAMMIIGGSTLSAGFASASLLLIIFSTAIGSGLRRKLRSSCNCFGVSAKPMTVYGIWTNLVFLLVALFGLRDTTVASVGRGHLDIAAWGLIGVGALILVATCTHLVEVVQFLQST